MQVPWSTTITWLLAPLSVTTLAGMGQGPGSLSGLLLDIETLTVPAGATLMGITSLMWSEAFEPILFTILAEFGWRGKVSTGTFQMLFAGKTEQPPTEGCASAKPLNPSKAITSFFIFRAVSCGLNLRRK